MKQGSDKTGFAMLGNILNKYKIDEPKARRISREWQDYAYRLAVELEDIAHTSLYMRLCKNTPRHLLEEARLFVHGRDRVKSKARLFMWKLGDVKRASRDKKQIA